MPDVNSCVAVYDLQRQIEACLDTLCGHGVDLRKVSVIGKGRPTEQQPFAFYRSTDGIRFCGEHGEFWNRMHAMLGSAVCFWSPGYGPIAAVGSIAAMLADRSDKPAITGRLRMLGTALYAVGVSGESALRYEAMVGEGHLLLVVQGDRDEVDRASETIAGTDGVEMAVHAA